MNDDEFMAALSKALKESEEQQAEKEAEDAEAASASLEPEA